MTAHDSTKPKKLFQKTQNYFSLWVKSKKKYFLGEEGGGNFYPKFPPGQNPNFPPPPKNSQKSKKYKLRNIRKNKNYIRYPGNPVKPSHISPLPGKLPETLR